MDGTTSTVTALLLGPGGAIAIMVYGARWLIKRIEQADEERRAAAARMETLVADNTRAMLATTSALQVLSGKVDSGIEKLDRISNGLGHREHTDPGKLASG